MNLFDKICAVLAFIIGAIFLPLGVVGLFMGCKANFTLPPVLGFLPALVGWGIVKPIIVAWKTPKKTTTAAGPNNGYSMTTDISSERVSDE
jgi:hypothetical protein